MGLEEANIDYHKLPKHETCKNRPFRTVRKADNTKYVFKQRIIDPLFITMDFSQGKSIVLIVRFVAVNDLVIHCDKSND